jgi:poly(glycerol-phosphate) alpha-glucosyltransferase
MRVAQVLDGVSTRNGGVFEVAWGVARAASGRFESHVFGVEDGPRPAPGRGVAVHASRALGPRRLALAPALGRRLLEADLDLLHAHGLWSPQALWTLLWARRTRRPYLVSPHGMLDPWALRRSRARKRMAAALYERRRLEGAACVHVLGGFEREALRSFGVQGPVCEIPGAVDLPAGGPAAAPAPWEASIETGRPVLLYLGRLHPKKGLVSLLPAFAGARSRAPGLAEPWRVAVAGWDEGGHRSDLSRLARALGLERALAFTGPLTGPDRDAAYAAADAFVLPSLSEGLPLTVLEAWAHRLPVLMTEACHLPCGFSAGAALALSGDARADAAVLASLFSTSAEDRREMGRRGRALVEERFSWEVVGRQYTAVYSWLLGGGPTPGCVDGG